MKLSFGFLAIWVAMAVAQVGTDCPDELMQSEDCYEVLSPIACYNQFRWNQQTLTCINGSDAEKKAKFCKCAKCVGTPMVNWVTTQGFCTGSAGGGGTPIGKGKGKGKRRSAVVW